MRGQNKIGALEEALAELETINRIIGRICQLSETNHIMSIIVDELVKYTGASQGVINLVRAGAADDMETIVRDRDIHAEDDVFRLDDLIAGWVLTEKKLLKIDDIETDNRFPAMSSKGGRFTSITCAPMMARGKVIGLTSLVRDAQAGPFTDDQCRMVGIVASQSAHILANALLMQELAKKNELLEAVRLALSEENARLQTEVAETFAFESIIGKSPAMKRVLTLTSKVSANDIPVLITGPTGTGKELIARAIHYNSRRSDKPFVVKNCGVKTESLLESELFGHVKGAFTGADRSKVGLFKEADGGTVFLDEIGDAPLSTQVAILRVLETGEIRPIGAENTEFVDVRVLSATNADLKKKISEGTFREDLFFRLNTVTIDVPSLNRRVEDIPILIHHFLSKLKARLGYDRLSISPEAMNALTQYGWPGNVRQLQNEIERAAVVCDMDRVIDMPHLSKDILGAISPAKETPDKGPLRQAVEQVEREMITDALTSTGGNILKSSQMLGLTRKGLKDKLARYGIDPEKFHK
jgi:Nif-specific regulatory protein